MAISFIGGENRSIRKYTSPRTGFELITLLVIGTDDIGSCKSNYHTIMTTTAPRLYVLVWCEGIYERGVFNPPVAQFYLK